MNLNDIFIILGLSLLGIGLYFIFPPAMYIVLGVVLLLFGLLGIGKVDKPNKKGGDKINGDI
ncbi:hypothetical protein BTR23_07415 [Alkalihalophilus pseudofirmus]|nr:hypothetical protein BTR23_07415 [Alkalihalophilus pseudofirmus]